MHVDCYIIPARLSLPRAASAPVTSHTEDDETSSLGAEFWSEMHLPSMFAAIQVRHQAAVRVCVRVKSPLPGQTKSSYCFCIRSLGMRMSVAYPWLKHDARRVGIVNASAWGVAPA